MKAQRGIQSVEVGGRLLLALVHEGRPMALKDLAQAAGMAPAKAHPYLVSFGKLGLIAQDESSGRYGLGPLSMQLGLISLQQSDPVRMATAQLPALAQAVGQTVGIAVWGSRGATIVRTEEGPAHVHVGMRHGTVMSLRGTASGKLFAAWLPRAAVRASDPDTPFDAAFERDLEAIRAAGIAHAVDAAVAGAAALAGAAGPLAGTEKPPLARAGRVPWAEDVPDGPVTFMACDSSTCRTIVITASPFG